MKKVFIASLVFELDDNNFRVSYIKHLIIGPNALFFNV